MKFSIWEDGKDAEKQIFFCFKQASEITGIPAETLSEVFKKGGRGRYFRRTDKKVFWIYDENQGMPFIRIENKDFPDIDSVGERFCVSREDIIYQFCGEREKYFYDSQGEPHYISWIPLSLRPLIDAMKHAKMTEKALSEFAPKGAIQEKARSFD